MSKRRYQKGERITSIHAAIDLILAGETVYWRHKAQNAAWMRNLSLDVLNRCVQRGYLYMAVPTEPTGPEHAQPGKA